MAETALANIVNIDAMVWRSGNELVSINEVFYAKPFHG